VNSIYDLDRRHLRDTTAMAQEPYCEGESEDQIIIFKPLDGPVLDWDRDRNDDVNDSNNSTPTKLPTASNVCPAIKCKRQREDSSSDDDEGRCWLPISSPVQQQQTNESKEFKCARDFMNKSGKVRISSCLDMIVTCK